MERLRGVGTCRSCLSLCSVDVEARGVYSQITDIVLLRY